MTAPQSGMVFTTVHLPSRERLIAPAWAERRRRRYGYVLVEEPEMTAQHRALYVNRELAWLAFNARVLDQAGDGRWPLLERVKFLAIFASNLDGFFMIRVAGSYRRRVPPPGDAAIDAQVVVSHAVAERAASRKRNGAASDSKIVVARTITAQV